MFAHRSFSPVSAGLPRERQVELLGQALEFLVAIELDDEPTLATSLLIDLNARPQVLRERVLEGLDMVWDVEEYEWEEGFENLLR